jgi:protein tyrosine phosphatase (PTP) superfamily phosphohydrolase (DUF442 family)
MTRRSTLSLALALPALFFWAISLQAAPGPELLARPSEWATAVPGTSVANLYRIEDGLYRAAQPTAAGFTELSALGVHSVLDVAGGAGDGAFVSGDAIRLFHVPMSAWGLHDDLVLRALRIMADPANRPLLVHCQHGADRTGAMVALYRVVVQGWKKADAIREMNRGGYHHTFLWKNLDRYVDHADVASLRKALGLAETAAAASAGAGASEALAIPTADPSR